MTKLSPKDLCSLEQYAQSRVEFRKKVMEHKKNRQLALGENARLFFEDEITIRYQIQEMLHIEKIFDPEGIQGELNAYNPLIPDGSNWKVTFMLQYEDPQERTRKTQELLGIEKMIWVQVEGFEKIYPIANEDLDRDDDEKTSTVHFLRFEFTPVIISAIQGGGKTFVGIDHEFYRTGAVEITGKLRDSLLEDLKPLISH